VRVPAIRTQAGGYARWVARLRFFSRGVGYAVALLALLNVGWMLEALIDLPSLRGLQSAREHLSATFAMISMAALPALAVMVVAVNLAPGHGAPRIAWLLGVGALAALWSQSVVGRGMPERMWLACLAEATVWTSLCMAVFVYHRDVRDASGRLLRAAIDRAEIDAELKRAELRLLQAQLEPHFLFNTLSAVRSLGQTDRIATVTMLDHLGRYFSAELPRLGRDRTTLGEELALVDAYLAIFEVRLGSRLSYRFHVPPECAADGIPPLTILTLVENALKHGIAPAIEGGSVLVSARRETGTLLVQVADSGHGMDARIGRGLGLANVRQRLLMQYGDAASLTLATAVPRGVIATVRIPLRGHVEAQAVEAPA
jgi:Histidine kinase